MIFTNQHIISANQFSHESLQILFQQADTLQKKLLQHGILSILADKVMATLFYEPSTRTRLSFEAAMNRLGGRVISTSHAKQYSSVTKGESLTDTIRTVQQYADVIVLRHTDKGAAEQAASVSTIPILNAGDGEGEHPTQALLDTYTILQETNTLDNLKIAVIGDLKYGRTVHSLAQLVNLFHNELFFVSPENLRIPDWIKSKITIPYTQTDNLAEIIPLVDVLYVTRIQKERFTDEREYEKCKGIYKITPDLLSAAKEKLVIMHPLPRVDEISPLVDSDPRAAYFRQVKNGMLIRMALLTLVFGKKL